MSCLIRCKSLRKNILTVKKCDQCLQWNIVANHETRKFDPPMYYPIEMIPFYGNLDPVKLFFHQLNFKNILAKDNYVQG